MTNGRLRRHFLFALLLLPTAWCQVAIAALPVDASSLNVAIPVFGIGLADDAPSYAEIGVFPQIRAIEARYLPFALRRRMAASGDWGIVRVVDDDASIEELVVHGEILHSTATLLEIRIRAVDASGATWVDESFSAVPGDNPTEPAYEELFARVAVRLREVLGTQAPEARRNIRDLALLRYGARLAPETFGPYVEETEQGLFRIRRLPARSDPMLDRITRIREAEYVIIDAADEKYAAMHDDVDSIYGVWREFTVKSRAYEAEDERRITESEAPGPRGSFEAMLHAYENYKFSRDTAEERDQMAVAFSNEVRPILRRLNERLGTYEAWREGKYREWNRLLEELNVLETRTTE